MKKYILLSIFILNSILCFSQTKIETEEWIKGKFNKWKIDAHSTEFKTSTEPISLNFSNCNLILKIKENYYLAMYPTYITYTLPVGEIIETEWFKFENTNYFIIKNNKSTVKKTEIYNNKTKITYVDGINISFNIDGEDNFKERVLKAFDHLKDYCPQSPKKKEIF